MFERYRLTRFFITVATALSIAGCMSVDLETRLRGVERLPRPSVTYVTDSIACIGDMIADYYVSMQGGGLDPIRIAIPSVRDATDISTVQYPNSPIPADMTDMAIGIASRIGGPIRVIHIPNSDEFLDAARAASAPTDGAAMTYFNGFNTSHYRADTLLVYGALTEYDRLLQNLQRRLDGSFDFGGGETESNIEAAILNLRNQAQMTMDFRLVQPGVGDVINFVSSTNTVEIFQDGRDRSFGLSVGDQAIGYATSYSEAEARHHALRLLIELGLTETLGKYLLVPYWKCLPGAERGTFTPFKDITAKSEKLVVSPVDDLLLIPDELAGTEEGEDPGESENGAGEEKSETGDEEEADPYQPKDFRDEALIHTIIQNYQYAQFLKNGTRMMMPRQWEDQDYKAKDYSALVEGRRRKLYEILSLYRRNLPRYGAMSPDLALMELKKEFVANGVLDPADELHGVEMYTALWLNAPVRMNARWYSGPSTPLVSSGSPQAAR